MEINLQEKKLELIQWLSTLDDVSIIEKIMKLRNRAKADWWNEISREEKASILQGIKDAELNNTKPHSEARKLYDKWL